MEYKKKILVVDDEANIRDNIIEYLDAMGFSVSGAKDGVDAVQKAILMRPDLIISDINLPGMSGYEVLSTLEEIPLTSGIPFIFVSAKSQIDDIRAGMNLGADDYITKPFQLIDLLTSVNKRFEKFDKYASQNEEKSNALGSMPYVGVFMLFFNKFIFVNQRFVEITGCRENTSFVDNADIFGASNKDELLDAFEKIYLGMLPFFNAEIQLHSPSGATELYELYVRGTKYKGKNVAIGCLLPREAKQPASLGANNVFDLLNDSDEQTKKEFMDFLNHKHRLRQKKERLMFELTPREKEVLGLICEGLSDAQIADKLFISPRTVNNHRNNLLQKTGANNAASLVAFAYQHGLFSEND